MKHFLRNIACYAGILAACMAVFLVLLAVRGRSCGARDFALKPAVKVISVANSHTQCAIDPEVWPGYQNLSTAGASPWWWLMKLKLIEEVNGRLPECVIIECGAQDEAQFGRKGVEYEQVARFYPYPFIYRDCWPFQETLLSAEPLTWIFSKGALRRLVDAREQYLSPIIDAPSLYAQYPGKTFHEYPIARHFKNGEPSFKDCRRRYFETLRATLDVTRRAGVRLVAITTPCHVDYRRAVPEPFKAERAHVAQALKEWGVEYHDYWELPLENGDFSDADHLSVPGRKKFTALLRKDLGY